MSFCSERCDLISERFQKSWALNRQVNGLWQSGLYSSFFWLVSKTSSLFNYNLILLVVLIFFPGLSFLSDINPSFRFSFLEVFLEEIFQSLFLPLAVPCKPLLLSRTVSGFTCCAGNRAPQNPPLQFTYLESYWLLLTTCSQHTVINLFHVDLLAQ